MVASPTYYGGNGSEKELDMASDNYVNASDGLARAIGAAEGSTTGYHYETTHMTVDQQLKVAEVCALLAIADELSAIRHAGINPEFDARH